MRIQSILMNLKTTSAGGFDRPTALLLFVAAGMVAPFALITFGGNLSNNLPWSFWGITLLTMVGVAGIGYLKFLRRSHDAEDISISPDRR
jgi:hypothetical protein